MGNEIKVDLSQTKYQNITELKAAASEELKDKNKVGGAYSDNGQDQIFGGDGLKEGVSKDEVLAELKKRGLSDDVANGLWAVANTNAEDDIIDADEFATLVSSYESDFNDSKKGSVTLTSWINNLDKPKDGTITTTDTPETAEDQTVADSQTTVDTQAAELNEKSGDLVAQMQAEAAEEKPETEETEAKEITYTDQFKNFDSKVKQDENGQYYIETDKWNTNATDNLDCISRIIYNTYGVGYKSEEGQQILAALQAANPGTPFEKGLVYPNQRINLIDASEILGLTVAESEKPEDSEEDEGTETKPADGDSNGETPAAGGSENNQQLTLEQRTQNLEDVKMVNTNGQTKTFEGVNADGQTVTYTQDYKGDLVGNVRTATKDENGNITQENSYREDGTFTASWYEAGHYPLPSSTAECDAQGNRTGVTFYTYDENNPNKMTERQICDGEGKLIQKETMTWDSEYKTVTERHYYNAEGVETDKDGNVLNQDGAATGGAAPAAEQAEAQMRNEVADLRAQTLYAAMDRAGTDADAVIKIVSGLQGQDLVDVMNAYEQKYGESLEDAIKGDFSFLSGQDRLLGNLDAAKNYASVSPREEVSEQAVIDAYADAFLTAKSSGLIAADDNVIFSILTDGTLSDEQIVQLANTLNARGESMTEIIKSEFGFWKASSYTAGTTKDGLLARLEKLGIQ